MSTKSTIESHVLPVAVPSVVRTWTVTSLSDEALRTTLNMTLPPSKIVYESGSKLREVAREGKKGFFV